MQLAGVTPPVICTALLDSNFNFYTGELACGCKVLSKREAEVAALLCQRLTMAEIATKLFINRRTVEFHIANIYEKLKVRNRRELVLKLIGSKH